jgi:hypothetical protein
MSEFKTEHLQRKNRNVQAIHEDSERRATQYLARAGDCAVALFKEYGYDPLSQNQINVRQSRVYTR